MGIGPLTLGPWGVWVPLRLTIGVYISTIENGGTDTPSRASRPRRQPPWPAQLSHPSLPTSLNLAQGPECPLLSLLSACGFLWVEASLPPKAFLPPPCLLGRAGVREITSSLTDRAFTAAEFVAQTLCQHLALARSRGCPVRGCTLPWLPLLSGCVCWRDGRPHWGRISSDTCLP